MNNCNTELLREIFDRGLIAGLGRSADGQTCIEGAIALACGGGLSDVPSCVAGPDRVYAIRINDAAWSSPEARADALWPLALAQIGTAGTDRTAWVQALALGTVQRVLPMMLEAFGLREEARRCRAVRTLYEAKAAAKDAAKAAAKDAPFVAWATNAANAAANAAFAAGNAAAAADAAAKAANVAYDAADAANDATTADDILRESVRVALDAYLAHPHGT